MVSMETKCDVIYLETLDKARKTIEDELLSHLNEYKQNVQFRFCYISKSVIQLFRNALKIQSNDIEDIDYIEQMNELY